MNKIDWSIRFFLYGLMFLGVAVLFFAFSARAHAFTMSVNYDDAAVYVGDEYVVNATGDNDNGMAAIRVIFTGDSADDISLCMDLPGAGTYNLWATTTLTTGNIGTYTAVTGYRYTNNCTTGGGFAGSPYSDTPGALVVSEPPVWCPFDGGMEASDPACLALGLAAIANVSTSTADILYVNNPIQDLYNGLIMILLVAAGMIWFFRRK